MSKLNLVLRELHRSETKLARQLLTIADRHRTEHEIFHVARDIARWPQQHVRLIARHGREFGVQMNPQPRWELPVVGTITQRAGSALRGRPETGLVLLADLRRLHRTAAGVSLDWELLGQAAQAMRRRELLDLSESCHPQTLRIMRWANAQLKTVSPQVLAS